MVATLMAYHVTGDGAWWADFERVAEYTFRHFPDTKENACKIVDSPGVPGAQTALDRPGGEWFGYLTREGKVHQRFKGGPYKGCFHVPRALFLCSQMLATMAAVATAATGHSRKL